METPKTLPLDLADISKLKKHRSKILFWMCVFALGCCVLLGGLYEEMIITIPSPSISYILFICVIEGLFIYNTYNECIKYRSIQGDLDNAIKEAFIGNLQDKQSIMENNEVTFWFIVNDAEYETDQETYSSSQIGQNVIIYIAPLSKKVLNVKVPNTNL